MRSRRTGEPPLPALTPGLRETLFAQALAVAPREAVGLVGGRDELGLRVRALRNIATDDHAFLADPRDQFDAERELAADGLDVVAIYHSHPGGGIDPSPSDLQHAMAWDCWHLIVVPAHPRGASGHIGAWRWWQGGVLASTLLD